MTSVLAPPAAPKIPSMSSNVKLLPSSLENSLNQVVKLCNQSMAAVRAITLSTTEGVPLGRVYADRGEALREETLSLLETVWAPPSKQLSALTSPNDGVADSAPSSKVQQITAIYNHGILVHIYLTPIVVTVLCGPNGNLGAVRTTAVPLLQKVLEPLRTTLVESLKPDGVEEAATPVPSSHHEAGVGSPGQSHAYYQ